MSRTYRLGRSVGVLLLVGIVSVSVAEIARADAISGQGFSPVQWASSSNNGYIQYSATVSGGSQAYLNVVASDGTWVVQNMPVGFEPGSHTIATLIDSSLFVSGGVYQTTLNAVPQTSPPPFISGQTFSLGSTVHFMANDINGREANGDGTFTDPGTFSVFALNFGGLFNFAYHFGVPDIAQGPNECAPTSAANSVTWLNNTYNLGLTLTTQQIRDILKDPNHMKTNPASGTTDANYLAGKNQFVADPNRGLKAPIATHFIAGCPGPNCIANAISELKKGEDVELSMLWIVNGVKKGGHWVTLVGAIRLAGGLTGIWFNDPDDGQTQTVFSWLQPVAGGFRILSYGTNNVVDTAFTESPVPEPGTLELAAGALLVAAAYMRRLRI